MASIAQLSTVTSKGDLPAMSGNSAAEILTRLSDNYWEP